MSLDSTVVPEHHRVEGVESHSTWWTRHTHTQTQSRFFLGHQSGHLVTASSLSGFYECKLETPNELGITMFCQEVGDFLLIVWIFSLDYWGGALLPSIDLRPEVLRAITRDTWSVKSIVPWYSPGMDKTTQALKALRTTRVTPVLGCLWVYPSGYQKAKCCWRSKAGHYAWALIQFVPNN